MICEACGEELRRDLVELDPGDGRIIAQAGWYCLQCGTARFSVADLHAAERQLRLAGPAELLRIVPPAKAA